MSTTLNGRHGAHNDSPPPPTSRPRRPPSTSRSRASASPASRRSSASARPAPSSSTTPSSSASSTSGPSRRARTCRASRRSSTTSSARSILGESGFKAEQLAQRIAERVRERQDALRAEVTIAARYPEHKPAPVSGIPTQEIYTLFGSAVASRARHAPARRRRRAGHDRVPVRAGARRRRARASASSADGFTDDEIERIFERVPVATHNQRGLGHAAHRLPRGLRHRDRGRRRCWTIVENSMSSEIYELMKRSDEGAVVEKAHRRPRFVEDCVREMIGGVVEQLGDAARRRVRLRAPGEPRDDPPAQRRRRALRAARRAAPRADARASTSRITRRCASGWTPPAR